MAPSSTQGMSVGGSNTDGSRGPGCISHRVGRGGWEGQEMACGGSQGCQQGHCRWGRGWRVGAVRYTAGPSAASNTTPGPASWQQLRQHQQQQQQHTGTAPSPPTPPTQHSPSSQAAHYGLVPGCRVSCSLNHRPSGNPKPLPQPCLVVVEGGDVLVLVSPAVQVHAQHPELEGGASPARGAQQRGWSGGGRRTREWLGGRARLVGGWAGERAGLDGVCVCVDGWELSGWELSRGVPGRAIAGEVGRWWASSSQQCQRRSAHARSSSSSCPPPRPPPP